MNDIVVGIDRSETAASAAAIGAEMASALGVNLHLVTCADESGSSGPTAGSHRAQADPLADAELFLHDAARQFAHDQVTCTVRSGSPATVLCDEARRLDARMIVVGNRRVQGDSRVLGSVGREVLTRADCDVLIVDTTT